MAARSFVSLIDKYFDRFHYCDQQIEQDVSEDLKLIVVIPCYNEENLEETLDALQQCVIPANASVEVIVVVNHGKGVKEEIIELNNESVKTVQQFSNTNTPILKFHCIKAFDLPVKRAGVGLARKIGMDEALRRFSKIEHDGIIVCFDADSLCEVNYFQEIYSHFKKHPKTPGCALHFEHPIEGQGYNQEVYDAIVQYELHLRYYKNALQFTGLPYIYHTIGSSMAVRASAYAKQGGMNKRKAGEDFYFLNKIIQLGDFTELNETKVIPSPRVSDRVPFGTGKAVGDLLDQSEVLYLSYHPDIFIALKDFVNLIKEKKRAVKYMLFPEEIQGFISEEEFDNKMSGILGNSTSDESMLKRFFQVFDAFWVLKYVHFSRDNYYSTVPTKEAAIELLKRMAKFDGEESTVDLLAKYRKIDTSKC